MDQYNVMGMSCAACQARVEKAVGGLPGVDSCVVNLLTNSMGVEGSATTEDIIKAVRDAGYDASPKQSGRGEKVSLNYEKELKDTQTPLLKKRLLVSVLLLIPLMYVSMGHMMWDWPLPDFFVGNHVAMGIYELLLCSLIMVINQRFFISGFKGLLHKAPNMDTLVSLGATASYCYSLYALFAMTGGDAAKYMDELYFESAAMILTLITVGKTLEARSKGKTTDALKSLMKLAPQTAVILEDGIEKTIPVEELKVSDRFVVRSGDSIPVDGIVVEGSGAVNEAALTGESIPVDKSVGDSVSAATVNTSGYMICEAVRVGEDTALAQIIKMVSDASATKAPIAKIADKVSGVFVPSVMSIALITFVVWMLCGQTVGYAIARAVSVLVISCPCALGLATPVAIMVGNGVAAKSGILFKTAVALEQTGQIRTVALDKTGTITTGDMQVTDVIPVEGISEDYLLQMAYSLELKSEHPISGAIIRYGDERSVRPLDTSDFKNYAGNGLCANVSEGTIYGGNPGFISAHVGKISGINKGLADGLALAGKTPIYFALNDKILGIIALADTIKEDSAEAIAQLKNMGIHVVMLTGDNELTARSIGAQAGVDEIAAQVKPGDKAAIIKKLSESGSVAMVGDGINDAPALTQADVGIAIGAGTDVAIDAADVVLMKSSLMDAAAAIRISRSTIRNIRENLFWAFFYNICGIPLAAGCYVAAFGWTLNPMFGAAAMGLSSFCVVSNALRLNLIAPYETRFDKMIKNPIKGELIKNIRKEDDTMKIEVKGMMCAHCEAHVKKALEAIEGIDEAVADHESNTVTIKNSADVDMALIKAAVESEGYEFVGLI